MAISRTRFLSLRAAAAVTLATTAMTAGLAAPAHADPRVFTARITIDNQTRESFELISYEVTEGENVISPNQTIPAKSSDWLKTTANVDQGGTSGSVKYAASGGGQLVIYFSNPYEEPNSSNCFVPEGLSCSTTDNGQYETEMTFTITNA
ncbi:hypothetical protein [Actinoplanes philippinensis]|uniref:hypothetical protein n=1 Tax=Actinoplanes philippinensis TaxID=35752 RepID=UPI0033E5959A